MLEKDLAHLRFLHNVSVKGQYLNSDDVDFVMQKKIEIELVLEGVNEILELQRIKESCL